MTTRRTIRTRERDDRPEYRNTDDDHLGFSDVTRRFTIDFAMRSRWRQWATEPRAGEERT